MSKEAQKWFDRGLVWCYSFNHEEAFRCFERAANEDEQCVMAYWGMTYAIGPNYNKSWPRFDKADVQTSTQKAQDALSRGRKATQSTQPLERALLEAISSRFPGVGEIPVDLSPYDRAYAEAMRRVHQDFGEDLDVVALFADALMCIRPRQLWDLNTGMPTTPDTIEGSDLLESGMARPGGREHPGLNHLYIHMMEMAPHPEKAIAAADRLRRLVPEGSHMQHMSTHIDIACGDYRRGIDSNTDAMLADDKYFARETGSILYTAYRAHNIQVLIYAAMMAGRSEKAISAAMRLPEIITRDLLLIKSPPMIDWAEFLLAMPAYTLIRFGRWEEILRLELPTDQELLRITTAMTRYARALALGLLGRLEEATTERREFEQARQLVPPDRRYGIACLAKDVLDVASLILEGELEYRAGNHEKAYEILRAAVKLEDQYPYSDPPVSMQPVRHALGALLLEQGHVEEAEEIYKQDLGYSTLPRRKARINNVWGLHGLYECCIRSGKQKEAQRIRLQHDIAMATADVPVGASCFCRLKLARVEADRSG